MFLQVDGPLQAQSLGRPAHVFVPELHGASARPAGAGAARGRDGHAAAAAAAAERRGAGRPKLGSKVRIAETAELQRKTLVSLFRPSLSAPPELWFWSAPASQRPPGREAVLHPLRRGMDSESIIRFCIIPIR